MNVKHKSLIRSLFMLAVVILIGLNLLSVAQASPPAQDPRPPSGGGGGGGGGGGSSGGGESGGNHTGDVGSSSGPGCASMIGQVTNWGFGPQGDTRVELKTGSWQTATTSASDGNYGLGGLGVGIATLH